jgi:Replication initiator protein A
MATEPQENTAKVVQLDDYDRSLGTDELNLAEFPLASLASRIEPGQNTLLFEDTIWDDGANAYVNRSLVIAGSDHFGLPTNTDSDILLLLVHLSNVRNGFKSKRVEFSRYELIKFLGWPQDGRSYKRLDESLQRWTSVTLHYKHAWWQRSGQKWRTRSFHILETLELRGKDEIHDDGLSCFTWNDVLFESFNSGNLRRIDLGVYFNLELATSRQMFRFLDKRFYKKSKLVFDLAQFATEHIGLSRKYDIFEIKRKLGAAIRELESIGFLRPLTPAERFTKLAPGKWEITLEKGQSKLSAKDSQKQQIVSELKRRGIASYEFSAIEVVFEYASTGISAL